MIGSLKNNVSFGYKVFLDSGASKLTSIKIKIESENGQDLYKCEEAPVAISNKEYKAGYRSKEDYLSYLTENIVHAVKQSLSKLEQLGFKEKLTGMCMNVPGYTKNNSAPVIPNIKTTQGSSLSDVDFNTISQHLRASSSDNGIEIDKKFKLVATNDMAGAAAAIAKELVKRGETKSSFALIMTGGGTGVAEGAFEGDYLRVKMVEGGHIASLTSQGHLSVEADGSSAPALIKNSSKRLGLPDADIEKLLSIGKAKLFLKGRVRAIPGSDTYNKCIESGLFTEIPDSTNQEGKVKLVLNGFNQKDLIKAAKPAIEKYIDCVAQIAHAKILEGADKIVITGPLASGIKEFVDQESQKIHGLFKKDFASLIEEKTRSLFSDQVGPHLMKIHDVKFIYDIPVQDNTEGARAILDNGSYFMNPEVRGNILFIPIEALKNKTN